MGLNKNNEGAIGHLEWVMMVI